MGGVVLYFGNIVEMCIGEGKMFVVIVLVYFNVFIGKGVLIISCVVVLVVRVIWVRVGFICRCRMILCGCSMLGWLIV